ncbi:MAG: hypothetical protein RMZ41_029560 [Nostoc sp. DedVER02]|nr:hypothetical protein [Nostoc sp. DedVER02]
MKPKSIKIRIFRRLKAVINPEYPERGSLQKTLSGKSSYREKSDLGKILVI